MESSRVVMSLYRLLLNLYPRWFQTEFKEELQAVFTQLVEEAAVQGDQAVVRTAWHELKLAPQALIQTHRFNPKKVEPTSTGLDRGLSPAAWDELPPGIQTPDGRTSWIQAGLEIMPCLVTGIMLVIATYLPPGWIVPGWQRDMNLLGLVVLLLPLPAFLVGLARGLPRWAFPLGGMVLGYTFQSAQNSLIPLLVVNMLIAACLAAAAALVNTFSQPLPPPWQRIGQSARLDWSRWSFGVYGVLPLLLITAFDNSHYNNRSPYLLISVLLMISGALVFARCRRPAAQISALLVFASLSLGVALLNLASFSGGLGTWLSSPGVWVSQMQWMGTLWAAAVGLMLAPLLLVLASRAVPRRRMG